MIPISKVVVSDRSFELVAEVLRSGSLAQGQMVEQFEARCAEMAGTEHAIAVSNGTVAIVAMLFAAGIGPGDEVVTTPFTFAATLNAILEVGATACFGDIGNDYNLDPESIREHVSDRTRAVLPVHLYGQCAPIEAIESVVAGQGIDIFEDAAQAHFATRFGRPAGGLGRAGTFSYYSTKNLFAGEGGCITTNDATLAARLRMLRNQGMRARYEYVEPGFNWRMTDVAAAIAIPQFDTVDELLRKRRENANEYLEHLGEFAALTLPVVADGNEHAWHQFTLQVNETEANVTRDDLVRELNEVGIGAGVYYPGPVYDHQCYREHPRVRIGSSPRAEHAAKTVFSIPVHQHLTQQERDRVINVIGELVAK